jgi:hypothetical protein
MTGGEPTLSPAEVQNLVQFALARGLVTMADARSHINAGLRSAPQTKTYQRWYKSETERLLAAASETERLYRAAIEAGEIAEPAPATLEERANGMPELASTQAAIRLLEKRRAHLLTKDNPNG